MILFTFKNTFLGKLNMHSIFKPENDTIYLKVLQQKIKICLSIYSKKFKVSYFFFGWFGQVT